MKVLIKKEVLESFKKKLNEKSSRGDELFGMAKPNFFGNFGSVKSFNYFDEDEDEDLPLKPGNSINPQMSTQLSVDAPPIDDPDFIPASIYELSLSAKLIAQEVPPEEIEYFYRQLHRLLDKAIDRRYSKKMVSEALNLDSLDMATKSRLAKLLPRYESAVKDGHGSPQQVADSLFPKLRTDAITKEELIAHLEEFSTGKKPAASANDPFVSPPKSLTDMSPEKKKRKIVSTKVEDPVSGMKYDPTISLDDLEGPSYQEMKDLDKSLIKQLVKIDEEQIEDNEFTEGWEFDEKEGPLTKVIFAISMALYDVSYEVRRMEIISQKGGQFVSTPETRFDTGIRQYPEGHPLSRDYAKRFLAQAKDIYGITPKTSLHQENIVNMTKENLENILIKGVNAVVNRIPEIKQKIMNIISTHPMHAGETFESTINLIIEALAREIKAEGNKLDKDIIGMTIESAFKRCLIDLPDPIKIPKAPIGYGGNVPAFKKRVKVYPEEFKKELPSAILKTLSTLKSRGSTVAKITIKGSNYVFEDRATKLQITITKNDLEGLIKNFVDDIIDKNITGTTTDSEEDLDPVKSTMKVMQAIDTEQEEEKEKLDKEGLTKDETELKSVLLDLKKMVEGNSWMHMAPLFGFSGASGIRQWFLKLPESKHKLAVAARKGLPSAGKALEEIHFFYDTIVKFFVDDSNLENQEGRPGVARILANELSKKKNLTDDDKAEIKLLYQVSTDLKEMSDMLSSQDMFDLLELPEFNQIKYRPGGAILQFLVGKIFDNVLKDNFKKWHANAVNLLLAEKIDASNAEALAHYLTGGNKIPDFANLKKAAKKFIDEGITKEKFYKLYEQSYLWFFDNMSKGLTEDDTLAKEIRYFEDNTLYNEKGKINKPVFNKLKKMLEDAKKEYQEDLGIQIVTNRIKKMLASAEEEFPQLKISGEENDQGNQESLKEFKKILKRYAYVN